MPNYRQHYARATALGLLLSLAAANAHAQSADNNSDSGETVLDRIVVLSAQEQLKQASGVSTITSQDLEKTPVANDISEIIRKMPGANLTGSSASGTRGNQRQIDLRGMGPENTLILIDGKPVLSRNSVRMGRAGERDTRGDSGWVPPEAIERIEVIRGPAAARYGSGAAGGVVNIVTKRPEKLSGTFTTHMNVPQSSKEGHSYRANTTIGGPINDFMAFRLIGGYSRTTPDAQDINASHTLAGATPAAGREGVTNRDISGLLTITPTDDHAFDIEAGFGRQGNLFAGDTLNSIAPTAVINSLIGQETNVMRRGTLSLTHRGTWDFGDSLSYIQWENTRNRRLFEGLAGGPEGSITSTTRWNSTLLNNLTAKSEWNLPLELGGLSQKLTLGTEFRGEWLTDPGTVTQTLESGVVIPGTPTNPTDRSSKISARMIGLYVEDNIEVTDRLTLTPGVRFDYHSSFGANLSPSLNASWNVTDEVTLKAGVARAFKAPNLFQLNPNYVYYTRGNGCPIAYAAVNGVGCYVVGNPDLDAETSLNKEFGINYHNDAGWNAGITWFHNDYKNRISTGLIPLDYANPAGQAGRLLQWENVPKAVVSGLEGNLSVPLHETLTWSTNFTWMIESKNKSNGQPLSLVPDYTINTSLDWQAREDLTVVVSATHYGETASPTVNATTSGTIANPAPRDPYTLVNLGVKYDISDTYRLTAGVNNVFDKRIFREAGGTTAGANTYNEPGRSFYLGLTAQF